MLPQNTYSSLPIAGLFLTGDDRVTTPVIDYEWGGVALNDSTQGLMVKVWRCWLQHYDVFLQPDGGAPFVIFQAVDVTELALTFDQNMRWSVAYIQAGVLKLRWFDSSTNAYIISVFEEAKNPKISLDDKRPMHRNTSDMVLAYIRDQKLYYRQQRDRFMIERLLRDNLYPTTRLKNIGMSNGLRMQFELV